MMQKSEEGTGRVMQHEWLEEREGEVVCDFHGTNVRCGKNCCSIRPQVGSKVIFPLLFFLGGGDTFVHFGNFRFLFVIATFL